MTKEKGFLEVGHFFFVFFFGLFRIGFLLLANDEQMRTRTIWSGPEGKYLATECIEHGRVPDFAVMFQFK